MPTVVYSNLIRQTYKHTPIILGGIEASLRRLAHYDYWENKVRRSVLLDSGADLISYGMGGTFDHTDRRSTAEWTSVVRLPLSREPFINAKIFPVPMIRSPSFL